MAPQSGDAVSGSRTSGHRLRRGNELQLMLDDNLQETYQNAGHLGSLPLSRCKVLLVGDSGVGKTSLRKHLMGEKVPQDQASTVGIETFNVESFDIGTNWKKQSKNCDDLNRSVAWWLVSHYREDLIQNHKSRYSNKTKFWYLMIIYIVQIIMAVVPLRNGFIYGFFTYYVFFLLFVAIIFRDPWASYGPGSLIMIFMVLADAVFQKQLGDYEEWLGSLFGVLFIFGFMILCWVFSFVLGCFGLSGFLLSLCIMNAPGETSPVSDLLMNELFTGQNLHFDPKFCAEVISSHIGTVFGLSVTAVIHFRMSGLKFKILLFLLLQITSLTLLTFFPIKVVQLFALGIPIGSIVVLGLELGRQTFLYLGLGVLSKMIVSALSGQIFGYMIGWKLCFSLKLVLGLPFLAANCYTWFKLHGKPGSQRCFPTGEFLKANQASKSGVRNIPTEYTLMDFAGQRDYHQMHHVFMVDMAVYCLVFNLEDGIDDLNTQYKRIIFWLTKIRVHAGRNKIPTVILVGTHRQSLKHSNPESEIKALAQELTKRIQSSQAYTDWLLFNNRNGTVLFTVENLMSASRDEGLLDLKTSIQHTVHVLCGETEHRLTWLEVVRTCKQLSAQGQKIMSVEHLWKEVQNASNLKDSMDLSDFQGCLCLANQAGYILYRDVSHLQKFVVLDQCFLMDIMKRFLDPSPAWALKLSAHWDILQSEGIATLKVITHIIEETMQEQDDNYGTSMKSIIDKFMGFLTQSNPDLLEAIVGYLKEIDFIHELNQGSLVPQVVESNHKGISQNGADSADSSISAEESESPDSKSNDKCRLNGSEVPHVKYTQNHGISSAERIFLIPSKLSPCTDVAHGDKPAVELFIDCDDTPVADVYPRFIARVLNKTTDIHRRNKRKPRVFSNMATVQDPDLGAVQIETFSDNPEQQLLCLRIWPLKKGAVQDVLDGIMQHFHLSVSQYFPFMNYTVGVLCPNSSCNEMRTKTLKHIIPITNNVAGFINGSKNAQEEGCRYNAAMCGTKSYQITLTSWTLCTKEVRPELQENSVLPMSTCFEGALDDTARSVANAVVANALCEWKNISRTLGVAECDIEAIEYAHPRSLKEQCRQGIWTWWKQSDLVNDEDKIETVIHVLREQKLAMAADVLQELFFEEDSHRPSSESSKLKSE